MSKMTSIDMSNIVGQYYNTLLTFYPKSFLLRNYTVLVLAEDRYTSTITKSLGLPFIHERVAQSRTDFLNYIRMLETTQETKGE